MGAGFFERIENADGTVEHRNYLQGPDGTFGVLTVASTGMGLRYWHRDHLGSPIIEFGANVAPVGLGFDAWGNRRTADHADAGRVQASDLSTSGTSSSHGTHRGC